MYVIKRGSDGWYVAYPGTPPKTHTRSLKHARVYPTLETAWRDTGDGETPIHVADAVGRKGWRWE